MIGKRTAARNLDQLATWRLATRSTREGRLGAHRRLSMGLDRALADIEFGITEIRIKKTQ
jgi:hypothetical protein